MIEISFETARKILSGLNGDKHQKTWSIEFLQGHMKEYSRKQEIRKLTKEWVQQFVREIRWDDPSFQYLRDELLRDFNNDKGAVIDDEVHHIFENIKLEWNEEAHLVIWSRYREPHSHLTTEQVRDMLYYINTHLTAQ